MIKPLVTVLLSLSIVLPSMAEYSTQGWSWYNASQTIDYSDLDEEPKQAAPKAPQKNLWEKAQEAQKLKETIQKQYHLIRDLAIVHPTPENVKRENEYRQFFMEQSKKFGEAQRLVLLQSPELSYQMKFPTQQVARQLHDKKEEIANTKAIKKMAKSYALLFFYEGNSLDTPILAKTVTTFAKSYGFELMGIPMDGYIDANIPQNREVKGLAEKMGVKAFPAMFLLNPETGKGAPLAYGFIALDQLTENAVFVNGVLNNKNKFEEQ
jgi:type-F conjugative transfer system pilin assembly protein TraF